MNKLSVIAIAAIFSAGGAWAESAMVSIDESGCFVPDANLDAQFIPQPVLGGDGVVQSVVTPSGNTKFTCSGTMPDGGALPAKGAFVITGEEAITADFPDGIPCNTVSGPTLDWHAVVTKSGRVSMTCHIKAND